MCLYTRFINLLAKFIPHLLLRLIIAWQVWDYGLLNYNSTTTTLAEQMMMPFNFLPLALSHNILIWWPLVGAIFLLLGFQVRLIVIGLIIIGVNTLMLNIPPELNNFIDFWHSDLATILSFKTEILLFIMIVTLLFLGAGGCSVDVITNWLACGNYARKSRKKHTINKKLSQQAKKNKTKYDDAGITVLTKRQVKREQHKINRINQKTNKEQIKLAIKNAKKQLKIDNKNAKKLAKLDKKIANQPPQNNGISPPSAIIKTSSSPQTKTHTPRIKIKPSISDFRDVEAEANSPTIT